MLRVCIQADRKKAIVQVEKSTGVTPIHAQLRRKTDVFVECKEAGKLYHPIGISYIENGRLRWRRVKWSCMNEIPAEIRENFNLAKYEDVSPIRPSRSYADKVVIVVDVNEPEKMALLFVLEKIRPAFKCQCIFENICWEDNTIARMGAIEEC